jgi:hypothetical protein
VWPGEGGVSPRRDADSLEDALLLIAVADSKDGFLEDGDIGGGELLFRSFRSLETLLFGVRVPNELLFGVVGGAVLAVWMEVGESSKLDNSARLSAAGISCSNAVECLYFSFAV